MGFSITSFEDSVLGAHKMRIKLARFNTVRTGPGMPKDMHGDTIKLKFSDGSFIDVPVP
jgi:hypothetical protein